MWSPPPHISWHKFRHSDSDNIWHIFCQSFWGFYRTRIVAFYLTLCMAFYLTFFWHIFWQSIWQSICLAIYRTHILTYYLWHTNSDILSGILSKILSGFLYDILTFFSGFLSGILSDNCSDILSYIYVWHVWSRILPGILSDILFCLTISDILFDSMWHMHAYALSLSGISLTFICCFGSSGRSVVLLGCLALAWQVGVPLHHIRWGHCQVVMTCPKNLTYWGATHKSDIPQMKRFGLDMFRLYMYWLIKKILAHTKKIGQIDWL